MSGIIFGKLTDHAAREGEPISTSDRPRWIKRRSREDADLMSMAEIKASRKITRQMRAVQFEHEARRYFAFFGLPPIEEFPAGLSELELTPGAFGIVVSQSDVQPKATPTKIRDAIEGEFQGIDGYDGHDLESIALLFPEILFVEADTNHIYTADVDRVLGAMVAVAYAEGPIALSEQTLKGIATLFAEGSDYIPYPNILQGLLSISWSGLFVELYRCIEQLYAVPRLLDLTKDWKSEMPYSELAELLENRLAWRPKEDESLTRVIARCEQKTLDNLVRAFEIELDEKSAITERVGRAIYSMRNGLVHFRSAKKVEPPDDAKWDRIIAAMLDAVANTYAAYGQIFHENVTATAE